MLHGLKLSALRIADFAKRCIPYLVWWGQCLAPLSDSLQPYSAHSWELHSWTVTTGFAFPLEATPYRWGLVNLYVCTSVIVISR
jgi:hypothetical protein